MSGFFFISISYPARRATETKPLPDKNILERLLIERGHGRTYVRSQPQRNGGIDFKGASRDYALASRQG